MKDPRLAAALLTSSPDALAELFDAYGDRLFRYCWGMLRSRELARVALRDTLLVAQANIARLADPEDPESLGPWLYSLARAECRRHQPVAPDDADESPARPGLPAADARLMSWHAAMSLEAAEFEALELACRHYVDLGQVLGLPPEAAEDLLNRARHHLERALGAEILAGRGPACPGRDAVLAGQPGPLAAEARERVLEHADGCAACGPEVPRNVSATRVFALLPAPALTPQDRAGILAALAGPPPPAAPALAQAALIPAPAPAPAPAPVTPAPGPAKLGPPLASYVRPPEPVLAPEPPVRGSAPIPAAAAPVPPAAPYVAAAVPAVATASPVPETPSAPVAVSKGRGRGKGRRLAAGAGVLASAVVIASAIAMAGAGQPGAAGHGRPTLAAGAATGPALQASGQSASPGSSRVPSGVGPAGPAGIQPAAPATPSPLASRAGSTNQVMITAATKPQPPGQAPGARPAGGDAAATPAAAPAVLRLSAGRVFLGTGSTGQITLTAANGTVSWSASASPPDQVSLSSYRGTLQDGQSVTVMVQVRHGAGAGRADVSFQLPGADPVVVPVTWSGQPDDSSGHPGHRHPPPDPSPSSGSMSSTPAPAPTSLGSPAGPGPAAATRPAPGPGGPKLGR